MTDSETKAAGTSLRIRWVQVEWPFPTHVAFCAFHVFLSKKTMKQEIIPSEGSLTEESYMHKLSTNIRQQGMDAHKTSKVI